MRVKLKMMKNIKTLMFFFVFIFSKISYSQHEHPAVNFDYSGLCYGSITFFYNTTISNTPATYTWTVFRQGFAAPIYSATTTNIIYAFPAKDTYTVLLCANNGGGHPDCMQQVFQMDSLLHADFQYIDCDSKFSSFSTCALTHKWDFGDGFTSTQKHPTHYYTATGSYTVKLVVSNGITSDSISKPIFSYTNTVTGNFSYLRNKDTVTFMAADTSLGPNVTYHWIYGDGTEEEINGLTGIKVKHKYPSIKKDSTYKAALHVEVFCHDWETEQDIFIPDSVIANETIVYPNPATGFLYIETERKSELQSIKLIDMLGKEVSGYSITENLRGYKLNISTLPKATYVVRLIFGEKDLKNHKIVVH